MFTRLRIFSGSLVLALFTGTPALAQGMEEIIVTASKREQTLQDVPIAVSVTDADTLEKAQIIDVTDLQSVVPSLRITQLQTSGNTNFVIRGFGNGANNPGIEPSVGVFIDGVYRSRSSGAISDLNDIQRVEVLRGPQSTLFGKNASAGVISVITSKPDYEFGGNTSLTIGNYGQLLGRGLVTGPLSDNLAFSVSGSGNIRDGYFDNLQTGNESNERGRWSVRGQLLWEPADNIEVRIIADKDKIDEFCCGVGNLFNGPTGQVVQLLGGNLVPNDAFARQGYYNIDSINDIENSGISLQADIDFDKFTLTSISSFRKQDKLENADSDFTGADLIAFNKVNTGLETKTQEFRITSTAGDKLDWMFGLFYFTEEVEFGNALAFGQDFRGYADALTMGGITSLESALSLPAGTFFGAGQGIFDSSGQDNDALSIFGQIDWHFSDRATLTLGANNTNDEKDAFIRANSTDVFSSVDLVQVGFAGLFSALTGGQTPTPANFAMFPAQFAQAQALSTTPCSATTGPLCNSALALQPLQFLPQFVNFPNGVESGNSDDSDTTWTVRLAYDVNEYINMYVSAATGFKSSSWNLSRDSRPAPSDLAAIVAAGLNQPNLTTGSRFAGPEEATVYEIGLKANFSRGAVNVAVFEQSIEGFQSNIFTGIGFALANAGKQSTTGLEIDGVFDVTEKLSLNFAGTFLDPVYDSFPGATGINGPEDLSGKKVPGIHEISIVTSALYTHDFANGLEGFLRGEYIFEDEVQVIENVSADIASRKVSMFNASAGLAWPSGFEMALWGRNINDDEQLLSAFPTVVQNGSFSGYPNAPRTYGLTLRKRF